MPGSIHSCIPNGLVLVHEWSKVLSLFECLAWSCSTGGTGGGSKTRRGLGARNGSKWRGQGGCRGRIQKNTSKELACVAPARGVSAPADTDFYSQTGFYIVRKKCKYQILRVSMNHCTLSKGDY